VAGLGRLDCDFGCVQVADFTHHDDVRILPQEGLEGGGKG